ncbi:MAG: DUF4142 domain-containing protein [Planctomycetaceae bacterium]|nr:DUF4142 domain-containing protein [Planctomycetaceae bacterium]
MWKRSVTSVLFILSFAGLAMGQATPPASGRTEEATPEGAAGRIGERLEQHMAACLILGNQEEVAISQFAEKRAQNRDVKRFAQVMVTDHTRAISMLERFAPNFFLNAMRERRLTMTGNGAPTADPPGQAADDPPADVGSSGRASDAKNVTGESWRGQGVMRTFLDIGLQTSENIISLTKNELGQQQGEGFDKAYLGQQIASHINMLAGLRAMEPYASGELRTIVRQAISETEKHMDDARNLMKNVQK